MKPGDHVEFDPTIISQYKQHMGIDVKTARHTIFRIESFSDNPYVNFPHHNMMKVSVIKGNVFVPRSTERNKYGTYQKGDYLYVDRRFMILTIPKESWGLEELV